MRIKSGFVTDKSQILRLLDSFFAKKKKNIWNTHSSFFCLSFYPGLTIERLLVMMLSFAFYFAEKYQVFGLFSSEAGRLTSDRPIVTHDPFWCSAVLWPHEFEFIFCVYLVHVNFLFQSIRYSSLPEYFVATIKVDWTCVCCVVRIIIDFINFCNL